MARPKKVGLDYFPFDIDLFADEKMMAISGEFGIKGEITAIKLLCAIYRNGYFIEWNEMLQMKMLHILPGISKDLLKDIVNRLVKWGFFDKTLFDSAQILTSAGIQRRYFAITRGRNREDNSPYLLLDQPTPRSRGEVPQPPRDEKPPATPPAFIPHTLTLDQEIETLRGEQAWLDQLQLLHHIDVCKLVALLDDFRLQCLADGRDQHQSLQDAKQHFNNWLRKVTAKERKQNDNHRPQATPQRRGNILNANEPKNYGSSF